jgi:proteasome lid subunit RPN8/RPN11
MREPGPFGAAVEAAIVAHALDEYPAESCGLVVGGIYRRCRNVAPDPEESFEIAPDDYVAAAAEGLIQAVVHSHRPAQGACPSRSDMAGQIASGLPWGIVVCDGQGCPDLFWWGDSLPVPPLVGRPFRHGVADCYSIIRDWYRLERGVILPEFPRQDGWWTKPAGPDNPNHYVQDFAAAGFRRYAQGRDGAAVAQVGDVICFALRGKVPHHAGVYLGDGLMLHHLADSEQRGRLSSREPVGRWLDFVVHWLRHRDLE